jgi:uncharacterized delta-60 repeat protein
MSHVRLVLAALIAVALGSAGAAPAEAAWLRHDPSFGQRGVARLPWKPGNPFQTLDGAVLGRQRDGQLLVATRIGADEMQPSPALLARFTRHGRLDRSFGRNGSVRIDFPWPFPNQGTNTVFSPAQIAVQRNGRIVVAGGVSAACHHFSCYPLPTRLALVGLLPNGRRDPSFGANGFVNRAPTQTAQGSEYEPSAWFRALVVQRDGGLLVASDVREFVRGQDALLGLTEKITQRLTRFRADGSLDEDFGDGGELLLPTHVDRTSWTGRRAGGLLGLGLRRDSVENGVIIYGLDVIRVGADGSLDPSFGTGGVSSLPGPDGFQFRTIARWPSGEVLLGGGGYDLDARVALRKLNASGRPIPGFHEGCGQRDPPHFRLVDAAPFGAGLLVTAARGASRRRSPSMTVSGVFRYDASGCLVRSIPRIRFAGFLTTPRRDRRGRVLIPGYGHRELVVIRLTRRQR